jgi:four helix bundle protein
MQNYKELQVWKKAHDLTLNVYDITKKFPKEEMFSLTSQIRRSCYSIPSNIAEGCGKFTSLDFANYLQIALGSLNETEYFVLLSRDLNYIDETTYAMLITLIKKIRV